MAWRRLGSPASRPEIFMQRINGIRRDRLKVRNRVDKPSRPINRVLVGLELRACPLSY